MRVLNVMLGKERGGLENAALDAFEALTRSNCQVTTVLHGKAAIREKFPHQASTISFFSIGRWDPTAGFRLKRLLSQVNFDVILAHGNRAATLAQSLRTRAPLVLVCHTTNYSATQMIERIDGAIVLTSHYHDVMIKAGCPPEKLKLVPNAIRLGPEPPIRPRRAVPLIGGLGRLVPNKGFDILLFALSKLKQSGIPFKCIIHGVDEHGSTSDFEEMRSRAGLSEGDVIFPGWSSSPGEFLRSLDLFVMPSRREVLSIALLEALEAGCPIICTKIPGLGDVFVEGREGLFVDIGDVDGLAHAIERLLLDPESRSTMAKAARERAKRFEIGSVGAEMKNALHDLVTLHKKSFT
jgi:glycosyltransferase involved in cell wall biosynthesis